MSVMAFRTQQVIWVSSPTYPTKPAICIDTITAVAMATAVTTAPRMTITHVPTKILNILFTDVTKCD